MPADRDIILTNIIFDGQVQNTDWNDFAEDIQGHTISANGEDTLTSQSDEFYNGAYVPWKIGKINDQMTYPEQYSDTGFSIDKSYQGQKGYVQYLPNLFQTLKLFGFDPATEGSTGATGDVSNILDNHSITGAPSNPQGAYGMFPAKIGTYHSGLVYTANDNPNTYWTQGATGLYTATNFGPPCYNTFKSEYTDDIKGTTGFKKVQDRSIYSYRYLPKGITDATKTYTAVNAWNSTLHTGLDPFVWGTRPGTLTFAEFEAIWDSGANLNDGNGVGWIPIFSQDSSKTEQFRNTPFLGVIYQGQSYADIPLPAQGEFFMMGTTPSLSQNDLHLPASTQQVNPEEWESSHVGIRLPAGGGYTGPVLPTALELQTRALPAVWATSKYCGASDPVFLFDDTVNRFTYAKFHTSYFSGNGRFQYGNSGASTSPQTEELLTKGKTSAFSKQMTLPNGYIYWLESTGTFLKQTGIYTETIEGNIIMDAENPGSWTLLAVDNPQYGSPRSATQFDVRKMGVAGFQQNYTWGSNTHDPPELIYGPNNEAINTNWLIPPTIMPYAFIEGEVNPYPTISAQSGIGVMGLAIPQTDGGLVKLSSSDYTRFAGTLFDKMGFTLNQFLPLYGKVQTQLNHTLFNQYQSPESPAGLAYHNLLYPVTTQALITSSLQPALCNLFGVTQETIPITSPQDVGMPAYNLGMIIPTSNTTATSESMFALSLPQKLSFPYLVLRSNIQTPCATQYIGGTNAQQSLPAIAYLMTNYATNDYFYNNRSDLVFTVNRPYVLTEIRTSIHLPNGDLADQVLDENSAVIYRIDFAQRPESAQIEKAENEEAQMVQDAS